MFDSCPWSQSLGDCFEKAYKVLIMNWDYIEDKPQGDAMTA